MVKHIQENMAEKMEKRTLKSILVGRWQECRPNHADASITVEAVFVIPLLMILFLAFLWLALHLHDRSVIEGALFQAMEEEKEYLLYGVTTGNHIVSGDGGSKGSLDYAIARASREEKRVWEKCFYHGINKKLFLYRAAGFFCEKTAKGMRMEVEFHCDDFFPVRQWGLSGLFELEYSCEQVCPVREEITRAGSVLLDLYEQGLGLD